MLTSFCDRFINQRQTPRENPLLAPYTDLAVRVINGVDRSNKKNLCSFANTSQVFLIICINDIQFGFPLLTIIIYSAATR